MEIDDSLIVTELKNSSNSGCRLLVEKYQDFLYAWGIKYYSNINAQILLELIDDTFLKVVDSIETFQPKSENAFRNWIFKIFKNQLLDYVRTEKVKSEHLTFESIDDDPIEKTDGYNKTQIELNNMIFQDYLNPDSTNEHPLAKKVNEFIEMLDHNNKVILTRCAVGYSHKEIAEWTGIPEGNIKVYYSRLKKKLEKYLISELSRKETL